MVETVENAKALTIGQAIEHGCTAELLEQLGEDRKLVWLLEGRTGTVRLSLFGEPHGHEHKTEEIRAPLACAPRNGWAPYDCPDKDCEGCPAADDNAA